MSSKLDRILGIIGDINRGSYPTVADLCNKYESAERTIHDDIRFIKDRTRMDIRFDKNRNGYYNASPDKKLPQFDLTEEEIRALKLGKNMLVERAGAVFRAPLESALEKISSRLTDSDQLPQDNDEPLRIVPGGVAKASTKVVNDMRKAAKDMHSVEIDYFTASTGIVSTRVIDPYEITFFNGAWYAIAWCHKRKNVVEFALHRVSKHHILKDKFALMEGFDIQKWKNKAFMIEHGDGEHIVRIKFTPLGARFAVERQWHPAQKIETHPDGSCTMEFPSSSFNEVKRWVLNFGAGAEVLDPPELRQRIMEELKQTLRGYGMPGN